jgi:AraC-like DNA-binding protein
MIKKKAQRSKKMNVGDWLTVSDIENISCVPSEKGRLFQMQDRKSFGLSFCSDEGQITYHMNGKRYISNRNTAVLLPCGGSYILHGDETGSFPLINFTCLDTATKDEIVVIPLQSPDWYLHEIAKMQQLWILGGNRAKLLSMLYELIHRLSKETAQGYPHLLTPAMEYLGAHLWDTGLSITALANAANLSDVYFRRLFKSTYGSSPKQYVTELRIRQAKQLLAEHTASVSAISERCGFASVYHFCRAFKLATGQTPTEYAKSVE